MNLRVALLSSLLLTGLAACSRPAAESKPAASAAMPAADGMAARAATPVKYRVELVSLWTKDSFPFEYPDTSLIHKPHFSGLIGAAHAPSFHLFTEGTAPSPGLERLSEQGKHDPLDEEIKGHVAAGHALSLVESDPLKDFATSVTAELPADSAHSRASLVAMIAPSPDWFLAVTDVDLMENGAWVASRTVDAYAWDSGGDDGTTFLADDVDTQPKKPTTRNLSRHFLKDGQPLPVARITFTKM